MKQEELEIKNEIAIKSGYKSFQDIYEKYIKVHGYIETVFMLNWIHKEYIKIKWN